MPKLASEDWREETKKRLPEPPAPHPRERRGPQKAERVERQSVAAVAAAALLPDAGALRRDGVPDGSERVGALALRVAGLG